MSLRVYNTLSRQKELFEPVRPGKVGMYLCGPTVYKPPHIGHMVGPVTFDAIKRYLTFKGFEVTWIVNITDIEDKLIEASIKTGTPVHELAEKYTKEYFECLNILEIDGIDSFPRAADHIPEIIALCQTLVEKSHAYAADGNVYFDVTKDPDYGKLSHRKVEEQESGNRAIEGTGKRNPADFAVWKAAKPGEPSWDSPWGKGRPGWHIECSAMSMKYLGKTLDIHGGGMDLMFPHHENELAQSESATGQPFAKYWLHNGLTRTKTKTNSGEWKFEDSHASSGNVINARGLLDQHGPELVRYMLLSTHYRSQIDFSEDVIAAARKGMSVFARLFERIDRLRGQSSPPGEKDIDMDRAANDLLDTEHADFARAILNFKMKFLEMMDDDFNTAGAIAVLHEIAGEINSFIERSQAERSRKPELVAATVAAAQSLRKLADILGMFRGRVSATAGKDQALIENLMRLLIKLRADARASKNFAIADGVRNGLTDMGIVLEDREGGTTWRRN
jgi:cysteinyl-tRNA synthetase